MIIVSATLEVNQADRDAVLQGFLPLVVQARKSAGCIDFYVVADPTQSEHLRVYEQWESVAALEAFRAAARKAADSGQAHGGFEATIRNRQIFQYEVTASTKIQ